MHRTLSRRQHGLTLVETLIAVAILAVTTTLVWSSFNDTFKTKSTIEKSAARYHSVRLAIERLSRDLVQAYISQNEDTTQQERRTFFVAKRRSDVDEVRFSYFGHQRLYADSAEGDTAQVAYYGVRDRDDSTKVNLVRRETRRLANVKMSEAPGEADLLCDDVVRLQLEYWDARDKKWREDWNTTAADGQPDRLPSKIRITLTVRDERDRDIPFMTEVRLPIQEPLNLGLRPPGTT